MHKFSQLINIFLALGATVQLYYYQVTVKIIGIHRFHHRDNGTCPATCPAQHSPSLCLREVY